MLKKVVVGMVLGGMLVDHNKYLPLRNPKYWGRFMHHIFQCECLVIIKVYAINVKTWSWYVEAT